MPDITTFAGMADQLNVLSIARERIAREARDRTGSLDLGRLGLTELPAELFTLTHLRRLNLGATIQYRVGKWDWAASDLGPNQLDAQLWRLTALSDLEALSVEGAVVTTLAGLVELSRLQWLGCSDTRIRDLGPLAELRGLQSLHCSNTPVSDLSSLAALVELKTLQCSHTAVSDLGPLAGLRELQALYCAGTPVSDLGPLARLRKLQELYCAITRVSDLGPLAALRGLETLQCSHTQVSDLAPLTGLQRLRKLYCADTRVRDLGPLGGLIRLQELACSSTRVSDLAPLAGLRGLQELSCSRAPVSDLAPLAGLSALQRLNLSGCHLINVPEDLWQKSSLEELVLFETRIPGIPAEVLSQHAGDDCLESLRAHLRDLSSGEAAAPNVKLIVLGNGQVGKTQICRRLRGEEYDGRVPSTHGVVVTSALLAAGRSGDGALLHIWDFGGQDIYHGTHALFLRSRAIFLIVWTPERESSGEHVSGGVTFRDQLLPYWLEMVRHLGVAGSPLLIVQTRCDRLEDEVHVLPTPPEILANFPKHWELHYSALKDRGRAALDEALGEAIARLREQEGPVTIGTGRLKVKRRLEQLRDADTAVPPERRQYRTITQAHFRQLCEEAGGVASPEHLLSYLDNAGIVFYRAGLFQEAIVLDQAWALEAVYAVFDREKCYQQLRHLRGRFTKPLLGALVWQSYSDAEQELFLGMMQSCGICFMHRPPSTDESDDAEYIAPDLLPDRTAIEAELAAMWDGDALLETVEFDYPFLHRGVAHNVISRIGAEAGEVALYWRGGLCVYETTTRSRALIEEEMLDAWHGKIRVRTQGGQGGELLRRLFELIQHENDRSSVLATIAGGPSVKRQVTSLRYFVVGASGNEKMPEHPLKFGAEEREREPEYLVSYAWGDSTPEGQKREAIVDQLCDAAAKRGILILRDKQVLGLGDSISKFMQRIGGGDRIFVILSDKYLHSANCMYELLEIWRRSEAAEEKFLERIKAYVLPGTKIFSLADRAQYAIYWQQEFENIRKLLSEHGPNIVGSRGFVQFKLMQDFARFVPEILELVADRIQPRTFEELEKHGLADLAP
jgi:internalin A